jgi:hypothetical protein
MQRQYVRIDLQDLEGVDIVDFESKRESASLIWSYRSDRRAAGTWLSYLLRHPGRTWINNRAYLQPLFC